jgi:hypothetical protein
VNVALHWEPGFVPINFDFQEDRTLAILLWSCSAD